MKETGILFTGEMVNALIARRKRQTRRPAKLPVWWPRDAVSAVLGPGPQFYPLDKRGHRIGHAGVPSRWCRYGGAGDRLWVRETWAPHCDAPEDSRWKWRRVYFAADQRSWRTDGSRWSHPEIITRDCPPPSRWRPSIHLPRWASRLTLEIEEVRLERVRSISREDAAAEGFEPGKMMKGTVNGQPAQVAVFDPVYWFAMLWNTIHGNGSYAADPWVWVVKFHVLEEPAPASPRVSQRQEVRNGN